LESGDEAGDVEEYFEEEEEQQQPASAEVEPQAATSGGLPTWGLPPGTQIFILLSVQQKVSKKVRLHVSTKTARHCLC
jgi:hypothetical protein